MADTEVARAVVTIVPTMEGAQQEITKQLTGAASSSAVSKAGATAGSNFGNALGKGLKVAGAATTAVAGAVAGMSAAFVGAAGNVAQYGDNIDKMSQKLGLSYEGFQKWDYVLSQSGVDINSMQTGLKTMTNKLDDAKNGSADAVAMFEALGLSMEDVSKMTREQAFESVIKGFQGMADSTERAALANDLFGKSGQNLTPLFNSSIEDTQALMDATKDLGMIMSDESVKAAAAFQDSLDTMQRSFGGLKNSLMSEFLPSLTAVMDGITAIAAGDTEGGISKIGDALSGLVDKITSAAPQLFSAAQSLVMNLAQAILDNLPLILNAALPIIMELANGIIQNLPMLFDVAMQMLLTLVDSLATNLPTLIPIAVDAVLTIVDSLINNVDLLVNAAIALMIGLGDGMIKAMPQLISRLPEIIIKLVAAFAENAPKLLAAGVELIKQLASGLIKAIPELLKAAPEIIEKLTASFKSYAKSMMAIGKDIVNGIWSGIKEAWGALSENVAKLGKELVGKVKEFFKIGSPSKLFADEVGKWIPAGIAVGIEANADELYDTVEDVVKKSVIVPRIEDMNNTSSGFNASGIGQITTTTTTNSDVANILARYLPDIARAVNNPINVTQNDRGTFNAVRTENAKFISSTGYHALA